jgi:RNA polymerase sigma factor (TIGR02999 family)
MTEIQAPIDRVFAAAAQGGAAEREHLFVTLYEQLRSMAQRELRRSGQALALSPTTLLHEAYLSLAAQHGAVFPDRARFMAYASRAMRGLIIDFARSRQAAKRGGGFEITALPTETPERNTDDRELSAISAALDDLAAVDADLAQLVDLKFFCGFSAAEIAALRGTSERTVHREWEKARMFLYRTIRNESLD